MRPLGMLGTIFTVLVLVLPHPSTPFSTAPCYITRRSSSPTTLYPDSSSLALRAAVVSEQFLIEAAAATFVDNYYPNPTQELTEMCTNRFLKDFSPTVAPRLFPSALLSNDHGLVTAQTCLLSITDSERTLLSPAQSLELYNAEFASLGPKLRREHKGKGVDEIVGDVVLPDYEVVVLLSNLVVKPESRRRGHAERLCQEVVSWAEKRAVALLVEEGNDAARALYEKMGYIARGKSEGTAITTTVDGEVEEVEVMEELMIRPFSAPASKSGAL